jgi:hypothetical protein
VSAAAPIKNSKLKLGAEPRKVVILASLLGVAAAIFIYNLSSGPPTSGVPAGLTSRTTAAPIPVTPRVIAPRRKLNQRSSDRNTIRMRAVTAEAQRGDIDPTLRLDLLLRLRNVQASAGSRNLFDVGPATPDAGSAAAAPKIIPGPLPQAPQDAAQPGTGGPNGAAQIPLKFYGFAAPVSVTGPRRGFFLDGDNILIAAEGDTMKGRYRVVSLSAQSAELEDVQTKTQQSVPLTPEVQNANF